MFLTTSVHKKNMLSFSWTNLKTEHFFNTWLGQEEEGGVCIYSNTNGFIVRQFSVKLSVLMLSSTLFPPLTCDFLKPKRDPEYPSPLSLLVNLS